MVRYDKFFWGIAQDDRLQSVGQYTYGEALNTRNGKYVELEKKVETVAITAMWSNNYFTCNFENYFCDTLWRLWEYDGSTMTELADAWEADIWDIVKFNDWDFYLFALNEFFIYDGSTPSIGGTSVSLNSTFKRHPIVVWDDALFFINWKQIGKILITAPTTVVQFWSAFTKPFETEWNIVGLTYHANSLWCYDEYGKMYVLDCQSEEVISFKNFFETIEYVHDSNQWYDIILFSEGNIQTIEMNYWVAPDSNKTLRKRYFSKIMRENYSGTNSWFIFNRGTSGQSGNLAITTGGTTYWMSDEQSEQVLYSYGSEKNVIPPSVTIMTTGDLGLLRSVMKYNESIFLSANVSWGSARLYKIDLGSDATFAYQLSGFLITKIDDFWQYEIPKTIRQVMLGADIPTWTSIKLEYSINEGEFVEYKTITKTDAIWTNGKKFEFSTPIEMFNEISWRITLTTNNEAVTPRLYSFSHLLDTEIYEPSQ